MRTFLRFVMKELLETVRTWRLPVLGGVALFFAITGPVLALLTPQLLESMQSSQPGVIIHVPDPTWRDAYAQWAKNLVQLVSFVVLIVGAGTVSAEVTGGTAALVLTKPVSRRVFVAAKAVALLAVIVVVLAVGTGATQAVTYLVFGTAPWQELWSSALAWLAFATLLVAITVAFSSAVSTLASAGLGAAAFFTLSILSMWGKAVRYSPVGLLGAPARLVAGEKPALAVPVLTGLLAAIILVALAGEWFARRDL